MNYDNIKKNDDLRPKKKKNSYTSKTHIILNPINSSFRSEFKIQYLSIIIIINIDTIEKCNEKFTSHEDYYN